MERALKIEFKRGIYSIGFYMGILLVVGAGLIGGHEMIEAAARSGTDEGNLSFLTVIIFISRLDLFVYMLPLASALAVSASYLEDRQSGVLNYILLRTTKKAYRRGKVWNTALFGFLVTGLALLLLVIVCFFRVPLSAADWRTLQGGSWGYYLEMFEFFFAICLNGSFYSLLGGVMGVIANNRYMAYSAPFILTYVVTTLVDSYLYDIPYINPKEWLLLLRINFWQTLPILLLLNVTAALGYSKLITRGWKND